MPCAPASLSQSTPVLMARLDKIRPPQVTKYWEMNNNFDIQLSALLAVLSHALFAYSGRLGHRPLRNDALRAGLAPFVSNEQYDCTNINTGSTSGGAFVISLYERKSKC